MKKIIALYGAGNRGKSTTLKMVYRYLNANFELFPQNRVLKDEHGTYFLEERHDIRAIFVVNGVRVGLETQGDPGGRLKDSLHFFHENRCKLIVCPTRTRGETVKCVERLKSEFQIEWMKKAVSSDGVSEVACNKADAAKITKLVRFFS